jgi:hypothetical protein
MKILPRGIPATMSLLLMLALASIATTAFAQAPTKSLKDQLVGHWQLVSVTFNGTSPYGATPQGSMFLDGGGHYSVIVITAGQARNVAYFGTYTVNDADSSITMHVDASSGVNVAGRDEQRVVSFSGDQLTVATQKAGGPLGPIKLTWKQAN